MFPSMDARMNKMLYVHLMEYYSAIKVMYWHMLQHGKTLNIYVNMKFLLSERSKSEKTLIVWFYLYAM